MSRPRVLVLNKHWVPISHIDWQKAFTMVFGGKAEVIENYDEVIKTPTTTFPIPAVIRVNYAKIPMFKVAYNKEAVFDRDRYCCQYCGKNLRGEERTIDHIIPRSHGGRTSFLNTVTCCKRCNTNKGNKLLHQTAMRLRSKPAVPVQSYRKRKFDDSLDKWGPYLR